MRIQTVFAIGVAFLAGCAGGMYQGKQEAAKAADGRVFELRTYTAEQGKLDAVNARFRNHTTKLLEKHGMENVGYWVPQDEPLHSSTLIYIVAHKNRDAAKASWDAFRADPEWIKVKEESEKGGRLVSKVDVVFMDAVDYSKMQ